MNKKNITTLGLYVISVLLIISCNNVTSSFSSLGLFNMVMPNQGGGINFPEVLATYPQNGASNVPINDSFIIVFNEPVDASTLSPNISITSSSMGPLSTPGQYSIAPVAGSSTTAKITFSYGGLNPLPQLDTVTVNIGPAIADLSGHIMPALVVSQFTTGTAPDGTAPTLILAPDSRRPLPGSLNVALTPVISIDFDETIDVTTLNSANFYLQPVGGGPLVPTDNPSTNGTLYVTLSPTDSRARLTITSPNLLAQGVTYRVVVTGGVTDLAGIALAAGTLWTFTTTTSNPCPTCPPSITDPLTVYPVYNTDAQVSWGTDKTTNYILRYGRGSTTPNTIQDLANYLTDHIVPIDFTPVVGKRYWIQLAAADYHDFFNNPGTNSSGIIQFNTTTNDSLAGLTTVANGPGNQSTINTVSQAGGPQGVFVFWTDDSSGNLNLWGQRYDSVPSNQWGAVGIPIFSQPATNYTYLHAVEDGAQGIIVLAATGGGIFSKRLDSTGTFDNWEGPTNATSPGLTIAAAGTNGKAAPVNAGLNRVLYAWLQGAATVEAKILDITGTPPAVQVPQFTLDDSASAPFLIPDGSNNGIVIYNRLGKIYGHKIDGSGIVSWGTRAVTGPGSVNLTNGTDGICCTPASVLGTTDLNASGGHDWSAGNEDFTISNSGTVAGPFTVITLDANCLNATDVVNLINTKLTGAGLIGSFSAFTDGLGHVGLQTVAIGPQASLYFDNSLDVNPDAMVTIGLNLSEGTTFTGGGWASVNQKFTINVNGSGVKTVTLNTDCTTQAQVITAINNAFTAAAVTGVQAYDAGLGRIGIRTLSTGRKQTFTLGAGAPDALVTLGLLPGGYTGTANPLTTTHPNNETIIDVQSDNAGGAIVLYKFNGNSLFVQRVDNTGTLQFGQDGFNAGAPAVTSNEVMACFNTPVNGVIVVAQANAANDIWAVRINNLAWGPIFISSAAGGGNQIFPHIFPNGANTIITWEDDRFMYSSLSNPLVYSHNTGWGIFGMKINAATGAKDATWNANSVGPADQNGVAVILNNSLFTRPKARIAPFSGGAKCLLLWEDQREGQGTDIDFINLTSFVP